MKNFTVEIISKGVTYVYEIIAENMLRAEDCALSIHPFGVDYLHTIQRS